METVNDLNVLIFDESNSNFSPTVEFNTLFLKSQQQYFNMVLRMRGYVFLNDVLNALGFSPVRKGQLEGWIFTPDSEGINFRVFGSKDSLRINFKTDGEIIDKIDW